ncbi:helix-turn-helix domain-containing protein [Sphaerochaeta sp. PS]|jgi:homeodomain-containing protein|uniref:helix-turn-helix domain-containing protein n=1 Tax=Sphaerochaeta sp. PS TaxID=3076336 RepID=UPI0028A507F9|nr:helix-turn-helix domain-containing protein [Sphaerochaeta sp. PS]MDT4763362.1 helix-turn-helix domain-containing protein [Sphaerochaeta sp. PS]
MKYQSLRITLTTEERNELEKIVSNGTAQAKEIRRANILLSVDESEGRKRMKDVVVARMLGTTPQTICQVKKDYLQKQRVEDSIKRKKRVTPPVPAKIDGSVEAHIIAIACSNPPSGYGRWTLRLIADRMVELDYIDAISHTAVGKTLKKTGLSLS